MNDVENSVGIIREQGEFQDVVILSEEESKQVKEQTEE